MPWVCCSAKNDVADDSNLKPASSDEDLLRSASEEPHHDEERRPSCRCGGAPWIEDWSSAGRC